MRSQRQQQLLSQYGAWAIVTGASSGIGRAMALQLAEAGLHLVLVARSQAVLEAMAEDYRDRHGIQVRVLALDLSQAATVATVVAQTQDLAVGLLIAAAGFGTSGAWLKSQIPQELDMLQVNCRSLLELTWHFSQRFAQQRRGGIVLLSSIVAFQGVPYSAHYAATKAYVHSFAEALAVELAPLGVDVLAAAPGPTATGFADRARLTMGQTLDVVTVAQSILKALGRRSTVLPGWLSKLLAYALWPLPRWAKVQVMGRVMQGMTQN
ncbi:MAG: SDR family NAD(P)-dependent oxidoreductase [Synechococcales cyanobacterium RU_4_20]|nr:SDR family NAD(P)-dependent oxidoreductase [Synechococcales cyanobacterium RU_4_20]NJR67721.1 SDR family NAD(P)-dependent oxidoreductase [Synechococcales cyanobacterium CRU_2_2]